MTDEIENSEIEEGQEVEAQDYEADALEMGWSPEEKFKGKKENWVSAKEFVERGEHLLPIIKATNKRLKNDLLTRDQKIATLQEAVESSQKAIKALQKSYTAATQKEVEQARKDLRAQIVNARELGDTETELDLTDKMQALRKAETEAKEEVEEVTPTVSPDFKAWQGENSWFGGNSPEDKKRSRAIIRIGEDLIDEGETLRDRPFLDKCLSILEERESGKTPAQKRTPSKVEGGNSGGRGSSGGGGFGSLPKDARDICHEDNDTFVGPGKMFKTVKEWEDHYYAIYNEG
jgi:hypothetical protein